MLLYQLRGKCFPFYELIATNWRNKCCIVCCLKTEECVEVCCLKTEECCVVCCVSFITDDWEYMCCIYALYIWMLRWLSVECYYLCYSLLLFLAVERSEVWKNISNTLNPHFVLWLWSAAFNLYLPYNLGLSICSLLCRNFLVLDVRKWRLIYYILRDCKILKLI